MSFTFFELKFSILFQVKIAALNDSHFIGTCLYNVVVLSAVGLTLNLVLDDKVDLLYGLISGIIIVGTTATQLVVFIPKVGITGCALDEFTRYKEKTMFRRYYRQHTMGMIAF